MDRNNFKNIAERVATPEVMAADEEKDPLVIIDEAADHMVMAVQTMAEAIPQVRAKTPRIENVLSEVTDLLETAIAPYLADMVELLNSLDTEE